MKRVLNITATNGGTNAKVRIEVNCTVRSLLLKRRVLSDRVLHHIADGVMEALRNAAYLHVPLSMQRVGR